MMRKPLILLAILTAFFWSCGLLSPANAEYIMKPYEIDNILVTFYWFDTELEMQEYYFEHFAEQEGETERDTFMRGFSYAEAVPEKNVCHLDVYAVRPIEVDDAYTKTIGHEVLHCVYGPDYHVKWERPIEEVTIEVEAL